MGKTIRNLAVVALLSVGSYAVNALTVKPWTSPVHVTQIPAASVLAPPNPETQALVPARNTVKASYNRDRR